MYLKGTLCYIEFKKLYIYIYSKNNCGECLKVCIRILILYMSPPVRNPLLLLNSFLGFLWNLRIVKESNN